jgi:hypothetical protein
MFLKMQKVVKIKIKVVIWRSGLEVIRKSHRLYIISSAVMEESMLLLSWLEAALAYLDVQIGISQPSHMLRRAGSRGGRLKAATGKNLPVLSSSFFWRPL